MPYDSDAGFALRLREVAAQLGVSVAQVAIAWVAAQGGNIVPLVGARTRQRLDEALGADNVAYRTNRSRPSNPQCPRGQRRATRYDAHQMALLDSER